MKYSKLPRLYFKGILSINQIVQLTKEDSHKLLVVLRLTTSSKIRLFNQICGEFICEIVSIKKSVCEILVLTLSRHAIQPTENKNEITLGLCIIKQAKIINAIENAVQVGINKIVPIISERVQFKKIDTDKIAKSIIESATQSERLDIPILEKPINLKEIQDFHQDQLIVASEIENDKTLFDALPLKKNIMVLVGPEGGFTDEEISFLSKINNSIHVTLGQNVLRTETAVTSIISNIMLLLAR